MSRKKRFAIITGIIAMIVVVGFVIYVSTFAFVDWWPPQGTLSAERTSENIVTFTIPFDVPGADGPVRFDNCAIHLEVNGQSLGPTDYVMCTGSYGWPLRTTHGHGYLNASVLTDGHLSYIVILNDTDSDEIVTEGDTISLIATEPFTPSWTCSIFFITELYSSWSPGTFLGNYTA